MNSFIKELEGQAFRKIGRASDMCWISFGKTIIVKDYKGNDVEKGTYALHIQCPWRIIKNSTQKLLLTSNDIYEPSSNLQWTEEFDWDRMGNNLFDENVKQWNDENGIYVLNVDISQLGDIRINLSNGMTFESFLNISTDDEAWRFFKCNSKDKHMICSGLGIVFE
ncbi:hypothetical protein [Dorea sp. D27]|uniref:hypothetical protein n=1 Tax=Dorea sp. D27 TaxID=658665 RepID=UPI0006737D8F|nr:hypothetical protein [Dorea sp. D27]KMZ54871.1 hypothetical protein HMPREF0980_01284 [Dorea sp. D27]